LPRAALYAIFAVWSIEQIVEIPADRHLRLDFALPETVGIGQAKLTFIISGAGVEKSSSTRIGFLKGRISVPADFDTMGQGEITALFEGSR
jgi:hypothetical protein